jgi:general secretion pathway protein A
MYNELFGLSSDPFRLAPDPSFLFLTDQYREALSGLTLAILQRKGLVVLTGEAGTGKTTMLARILQFLPASRLQFSQIFNPTLTPSEFLELALLQFGLTDIPPGKAHRLLKLLSLILDGQRQGKVSALIVDEAHKLSPEVLEEIRLLGMLEDSDNQSLQILLVGQNELDETLDRKDMRQFKQRIAVRLALAPLALPEVGEYMRHRWLRAGGSEFPFDPQAVDDIARLSQRIPRLINVLCDNALFAAFREKSSRVLESHVREVAAKLDLGELLPGKEAVSPVEPTALPQPITVRETKSPRWNKLAGRLGLTPRQESM